MSEETELVRLWHLFTSLVTIMVIGRLLTNCVMDAVFYCVIKRRFFR